MTSDVATYPLDMVDMLIVNETEAANLSGEESPQKAAEALRGRYPHAAIVLILGKEGLLYADCRKSFHQEAQTVKAVDTTAAGDTFIVFFLAELLISSNQKKAARLACCASALCVTKPGASDSIPMRSELPN